MNDKRIALQKILIDSASSLSSEYGDHVYYQAPKIGMKYPAIKFSKSERQNLHANNSVYGQIQYYDITVIERNPDKPLSEIISKINTARYVTGYISDGLYHEKYTVYI